MITNLDKYLLIKLAGNGNRVIDVTKRIEKELAAGTRAAAPHTHNAKRVPTPTDLPDGISGMIDHEAVRGPLEGAKESLGNLFSVKGWMKDNPKKTLAGAGSVLGTGGVAAALATSGKKDKGTKASDAISAKESKPTGVDAANNIVSAETNRDGDSNFAKSQKLTELLTQLGVGGGVGTLAGMALAPDEEETDENGRKISKGPSLNKRLAYGAGAGALGMGLGGLYNNYQKDIEGGMTSARNAASRLFNPEKIEA